MKTEKWSIGADIGGTHITSALVDIANGTLVDTGMARATFDHDAPAETILLQWAEALNRTLQANREVPVAGLGFAVPGPFDYRNGISKMQHKFKKLYEVHIPTALRPLLHGQPEQLPMRFINDATAFAIGESWMGQGRDFRKVVVITLGTGFGSAFLDADVPVVSGPGVPKEGCLWHLPYRDGLADDYFATRWFTNTYEQHTGKPIDGVKELATAAAGDPFVAGLFSTFGHNLAECLAPWLERFEAGVLIIGGNIGKSLNLFETELKNDLQKAGLNLKVVPSALWEKAALLGSARLLDDDFWDQVSVHLPNL